MKYDSYAQSYLNMLRSNQEVLSEELLMEDRIDYLKKNVKSINSSHDTFALHRETPAIIDFLASEADPSKKKIHTQHLVKMYNAGSFRQEDAPRVHDVLTQFDKYKNKLPLEQRDISKYSRISDIDMAVAPHIGTAATNAERKEQIKSSLHMPGKHELKYEDDNIAVYHLKDEATSKELYASKTAKKPGVFPTEWCTAWTDNRECKYNDYLSKGNMFTIHHKPSGDVFQMHPRENQFMDKNDETISDSDFEKIKDSLHKAATKAPEILDK